MSKLKKVKCAESKLANKFKSHNYNFIRSDLADRVKEELSRLFRK